MVTIGTLKNDLKPLARDIFSEENAFVDFALRTPGAQSSASQSPTEDFKYRVTEFTNKFIRGNFGGTIQSSSGEIISITEGEFYGFER